MLARLIHRLFLRPPPARVVVQFGQTGEGGEQWRWFITATYADGRGRLWSFPPRQVISSRQAIAIAKRWWPSVLVMIGPKDCLFPLSEKPTGGCDPDAPGTLRSNRPSQQST